MDVIKLDKIHINRQITHFMYIQLVITNVRSRQLSILGFLWLTSLFLLVLLEIFVLSTIIFCVSLAVFCHHDMLRTGLVEEWRGSLKTASDWATQYGRHMKLKSYFKFVNFQVVITTYFNIDLYFKTNLKNYEHIYSK